MASHNLNRTTISRRVATSKDVAELAGVSRATVSAVLSGREGTIRTSDQTKRRVLEAAKQLGYSPNPVAQALRQQRSGIIAYVPRHRHSDPGYYHLTYQLSLCFTRMTAKQGLHALEVGPEIIIGEEATDPIEFLLSRRPDGVLYDAPASSAEVQRVIDMGIPVVQLLRPLCDVQTAVATVDPSSGVTSAIEHLANLGHQRVAYLGNGDRHEVELRRLDAFMSALDLTNIPLSNDLILLGNAYSIDEGERLMNRLLDVMDRPTAVFAASDVLCMGAMRALYARNIRVPDEMSLVSFDDTHASMLYPPISAVAQPFERLMEASIELLMTLSGHQRSLPDSPQHLELETEFVDRASTAPPQAHMTTQSECMDYSEA